MAACTTAAATVAVVFFLFWACLVSKLAGSLALSEIPAEMMFVIIFIVIIVIIVIIVNGMNSCV